VAKAHKVAIIGGGAKIDRTMISQRDMDFWRLRKVNRDTILGAYGIPLTILGIEGPGSRARAEADAYIFARYVIKPRLTRFREKLNEQLCPLFGEGLELDFDNPVPENREQLITEADTGVRAGYLTINEARQMLGFDAVPRGDVFIMPMTMLPTPAKGNLVEAVYKLLPAKAMSEEAKEAHWHAYIAKTEAQEKPFIRALNELFREQEAEVLGLLEDADSPKEALFDQDKAEERFRKALTPHLRRVLTEAAEDASVLIHPEPAHRSKQLSEDALIWLMDRAAWLVKEINKVTRDALSVQLVDGFVEGESIPKLAARVRSVFDDCTRRRSLVIARTEVIAASNEGALEGYKASGVVEKVEFYAALDDRTDEDCMGLHGTIYSLKEAGGIIPVHPNCRCTWLPVIE
jgi:SPP1 gp7 family putative phage head morphogenesis protein